MASPTTFEDLLETPRIGKFLNSIKDRDLRQEARIAMWEAYSKSTKENIESYLVKAARWRLDQISNQGRQMFGYPSNGTQVRGRPDKYIGMDIIPDLMFWGSYDNTPDDPILTKRVRQAVATLPPRMKDKVFRRFWLDEPGVQLSGTWWYGSHRSVGAKQKLLEALGHGW